MSEADWYETDQREVVRVAGETWRYDGPGELRGLHLRYLLTTLLSEANKPLSVAELIVRCEREGVVFRGRASKIISDALRWEIRRLRVVRLSRGVYRYSRTPRSTKRWIARRVRDLRVYLVGLRDQASRKAPGSRPLLRPAAMAPIPPGTGFIT